MGGGFAGVCWEGKVCWGITLFDLSHLRGGGRETVWYGGEMARKRLTMVLRCTVHSSQRGCLRRYGAGKAKGESYWKGRKIPWLMDSGIIHTAFFSPRPAIALELQHNANPETQAPSDSTPPPSPFTPSTLS